MHFAREPLRFMVLIEVVFHDKDGALFQKHLDMQEGATVYEALVESGLYDGFPHAKDLPVGIFSKEVNITHVLFDGDRIEVYRPLLIDPKEKRRHRAKAK